MAVDPFAPQPIPPLVFRAPPRLLQPIALGVVALAAGALFVGMSAGLNLGATLYVVPALLAIGGVAAAVRGVMTQGSPIVVEFQPDGLQHTRRGRSAFVPFREITAVRSVSVPGRDVTLWQVVGPGRLHFVIDSRRFGAQAHTLAGEIKQRIAAGPPPAPGPLAAVAPSPAPTPVFPPRAALQPMFAPTPAPAPAPAPSAGPAVCPACARECPPSAKFCLTCGTEMARPAPAPAPPAAAGDVPCQHCGSLQRSYLKFCLACNQLIRK
jgi:hypothetical protein